MDKPPTGYLVLAAAAGVAGYLYHRSPPVSPNQQAFAESSGSQVQGLAGWAPQAMINAPESMGAWEATALHWGTLPHDSGGGGFSPEQVSTAIRDASLGNMLAADERNVMSYLYGSPAGPPPSTFQLHGGTDVHVVTPVGPQVGSTGTGYHNASPTAVLG